MDDMDYLIAVLLSFPKMLIVDGFVNVFLLGLTCFDRMEAF